MSPGIDAVLVTGACGYLGRRLIARLVENKIVTWGADCRECGEHLVDYNHLCVDLAQPEEFVDIIERFSRDHSGSSCVVHMAGLSNVSACEQDPDTAKAVNVDMAIDVLQACNRAKIDRFVFPSSVLVYGDGHSAAIKEDVQVNPDSVYGCNKAAVEKTLSDTQAQANISCDIIRLANVYDASPKPGTVMDVVIRQVLERAGEIRVQYLEPVRDYVYVDDVVEGIQSVLKGPKKPGTRILNLGTGRGTAVKELARIACQLYQHDAELIGTGGKYSGIKSLVLDVDKIREHTGWRAKISIEMGIQKIIAEKTKGGSPGD